MLAIVLLAIDRRLLFHASVRSTAADYSGGHETLLCANDDLPEQ